jgi:2-oxo-4-hydroxy-4-carboxy-5-ureidoimidazoline decarboxylase
VTPERLEAVDALNAARDPRSILSPLFEGAARFLDRLADARPFTDWEDLWRRARDIAHAMPEAEQIELLDAHGRLGAPRETVSVLSRHEQGYDGPRESPSAGPGPGADTLARLRELNEAYEARFGFRYCVFVAGRPLDTLIPDFEAALAADRDAERHRGLDAVVDIARARAGATTFVHRHDP